MLGLLCLCLNLQFQAIMIYQVLLCALGLAMVGYVRVRVPLAMIPARYVLGLQQLWFSAADIYLANICSILRFC